MTTPLGFKPAPSTSRLAPRPVVRRAGLRICFTAPTPFDVAPICRAWGLFQRALSWTKDWIDTILDDGAADDKELRKALREKHDLRLVCSQNPRRRKALTDHLPRGVEKITPTGQLICLAGHEFEYMGIRYETNVFCFGPPAPVEGQTPCLACPFKEACCPNATKGRHITLPFDQNPFVNPDDPHLAKRYKAMLVQRTAIERSIKALKCDVGTDDLTKRGNESFQARLDKTLIVYHLLLQSGT